MSDNNHAAPGGRYTLQALEGKIVAVGATDNLAHAVEKARQVAQARQKYIVIHDLKDPRLTRDLKGSEVTSFKLYGCYMAGYF